jgi:hypothetical protein
MDGCRFLLQPRKAVMNKWMKIGLGILALPVLFIITGIVMAIVSPEKYRKPVEPPRPSVTTSNQAASPSPQPTASVLPSPSTNSEKVGATPTPKPSPISLKAGDEVVLKYEKETDEKIYVASTINDYNRLAKTYELNDNEGRWQMILEGTVIAVENKTKARVLGNRNSNGSIEIRVLDGDEYGASGFVPISLLVK